MSEPTIVRERVERMTREGQMTDEGQATNDRAKSDGTWATS